MAGLQPITIVAGRLKPVGATKVTKRVINEVADELAKKEEYLNIYKDSLLNCPDGMKNIVEGLVKKAQQAYDDCARKVQEITTTVREYVDSKGARYIETVEFDPATHTGKSINKLEKIEEELLKDGRKVITKTTHDKSEHLLLGKGHQDGLITKVEELYTKDGVLVGRRTTKKQASGYGGKSVIKEASVDGQELCEYNTKTTSSFFSSRGIKYDKNVYEPGTSMGYGTPYRYECNEKGIPQIPQEGLKPGF